MSEYRSARNPRIVPILDAVRRVLKEIRLPTPKLTLTQSLQAALWVWPVVQMMAQRQEHLGLWSFRSGSDAPS